MIMTRLHTHHQQLSSAPATVRQQHTGFQPMLAFTSFAFTLFVVTLLSWSAAENATLSASEIGSTWALEELVASVGYDLTSLAPGTQLALQVSYAGEPISETTLEVPDAATELFAGAALLLVETLHSSCIPSHWITIRRVTHTGSGATLQSGCLEPRPLFTHFLELPDWSQSSFATDTWYPLLAFHVTPAPSAAPPGEPVQPPSSVLLVFWLIAATTDELPALPQPETPGTLATLANQLAADE